MAKDRSYSFNGKKYLHRYFDTIILYVMYYTNNSFSSNLEVALSVTDAIRVLEGKTWAFFIYKIHFCNSVS